MRVQSNKLLQASGLVALSGILYGFLGYLGTIPMQGNLSISMMLFYRFFIAGCWMLLFTSWQRPSKIPVSPSANKTILSLTQLLPVISLFALGALTYAGSSGFYFIASQYTGTGLAMVIFFSYPILIALISWLKQRDRLPRSTLMGLFFMLVGLALLQSATTFHFNFLGILFAILSAACYALYVIRTKQVMSFALNSSVFTMILCFSCAGIFLIFSLFSHTLIFPSTFKSWLYLLALGIVATAIPIQLMLEGLKYVSSMRASIISVLEPLVTVFVGVLLLDESFSQLQLLGTFVILTSALLIQLQRQL